MLNTWEEIEAALRDGKLKEHRHGNLELKRSWSQEDGKKLSMHANRQSQPVGWLVVGVEDDGTASGHKERWAKETELTIAQHLNQYLEPVQACRGVRTFQVDESWVLTVQVENPGAVVRWNRKAYKGPGTAKDEMTPEEVMALQVSLPGLQDYSAQRVKAPVNDGLVTAYASRLAQRSDEPDWADLERASSKEVLSRLRIHGRQASRLLFGAASYRIVKMDADGEPIANAKRSGLYSLLSAEFRAEIQDTTRKLAGVTGEPYPDKALAEALANAVAHAAHFSADGDIIVELHPDHLSISNLCLPGSLFFANKWFSRSHSTVNALLMETLRVAGIVDELGRGKSLIMAESLRAGQKPPVVLSESAGQYSRWKLMMFGGAQDSHFLKLLSRLRSKYGDEKKALLANALVHWRDQPLSSLRGYIDDESKSLFSEVLTDLEGPVVLDDQADRIEVKRWVSVLLEEGKDSKTLSHAEERAILTALRTRTRQQGGEFRPADLREVAGMANTPSEQVLSSSILRKWQEEGLILRVRLGLYKFARNPSLNDQETATEILRRLLELRETRESAQQ